MGIYIGTNSSAKYPLVYNDGAMNSPWTEALITPLLKSNTGIHWPPSPRNAYGVDSNCHNYVGVWDYSTSTKLSWTYNDSTLAATYTTSGNLWGTDASYFDLNHSGFMVTSKSSTAFINKCQTSYIQVVPYTAACFTKYTTGGSLGGIDNYSGTKNSGLPGFRVDMNEIGALYDGENYHQLCVGYYTLLRSNVNLMNMTLLDPGARVWYSDSTTLTRNSEFSSDPVPTSYVMVSNSGTGGAFSMKLLASTDDYYYTMISQSDYRFGWTADTPREIGAYGIGPGLMTHKYVFFDVPMVKLDNYKKDDKRMVNNGTIELLRSMITVTHYIR